MSSYLNAVQIGDGHPNIYGVSNDDLDEIRLPSPTCQPQLVVLSLRRAIATVNMMAIVSLIWCRQLPGSANFVRQIPSHKMMDSPVGLTSSNRLPQTDMTMVMVMGANDEQWVSRSTYATKSV